MSIVWLKVPWPQPSAASVAELLTSYGIIGAAQYTVRPGELIPLLSEEDNQVLSAAGLFGYPGAPVEGADYSRFSDVIQVRTEDGFTTKVYHDGVVLATRKTVLPPDTVELWNEVINDA